MPWLDTRWLNWKYLTIKYFIQQDFQYWHDASVNAEIIVYGFKRIKDKRQYE